MIITVSEQTKQDIIHYYNTELKDNTFENLSVNYLYGEFLGFYINRTNYANVEDNELLDISARGPSYYNNWGFYIYFANYCNVKNNKIDNFSTQTSNLRGIDAYYANNFVSDGNLFNKISTLHDNLLCHTLLDR